MIDSIETTTVKGLRDRALLAVMGYTFARVGAVTAMPVEDYFQQGKRWWFRFHEKGGKLHEVPAHHKAEAHVDAWIAAAGIGEERKLPLFRTFGRNGEVTARPLYEPDVLRMVKVRGKAIGRPESTCCHTFRATGITAYLENGGTIEKAQAIAAHASPRTTKLYDRTWGSRSIGTGNGVKPFPVLNGRDDDRDSAGPGARPSANWPRNSPRLDGFDVCSCHFERVRWGAPPSGDAAAGARRRRSRCWTGPPLFERGNAP